MPKDNEEMLRERKRDAPKKEKVGLIKDLGLKEVHLSKWCLSWDQEAESGFPDEDWHGQETSRKVQDGKSLVVVNEGESSTTDKKESDHTWPRHGVVHMAGTLELNQWQSSSNFVYKIYRLED